MFKTLSAPVSLQWEITPWCNHNCIHCYNFWRQGRLPFRLTDQDVQVCSQAAREIIANHVFHVTITGGEPLAVLPRLSSQIALLSDAGINLAINTNLTLLTPDKVVLLRELGFKSILTSLMAADAMTNDYLAQTPGAYDRTVAGIKLAVENGFPVAINMVVTKANLQHLDATASLAKELGAVAFTATKASAPSNCPDFSEYQLEVGELQQMFVALLEASDKYDITVDSLEHYPSCLMPSDDTLTKFGVRKCSAGKTGCTIGFDGQIRPCSHASDTYGHVDDGLASAWQNMAEWRDLSLIPDGCQSCPAFPQICSAGCRVEGKTHSGSLAGKDPYCLQRPPTAIRRPNRLQLYPTETQFAVGERVRFRREDFGGIAFYSSSRWLPVDENLYKTLRIAKEEGKHITAEEVANELGVNVTAGAKTLRLLAQKNIVVAQ